MAELDREEKVVFGIAPSPNGPVAILGVTAAAWDYMKDGKTHTFDLRGIGFPVQIMMFGAQNHARVVELLGQGAEARGMPVHDSRDEDFSMKESAPALHQMLLDMFEPSMAIQIVGSRYGNVGPGLARRMWQAMLLEYAKAKGIDLP